MYCLRRHVIISVIHTLFCSFLNSMFLERPIRAYSVGSRLEHNKRKMRIDMLSAEHGSSTTSRVRAFSVGSRAKVARSDLYNGLTNSTNLMKANSQDISNLITTSTAATTTTLNNNNNNNNKLTGMSQRNQNALNNNNNNIHNNQNSSSGSSSNNNNINNNGGGGSGSGSSSDVNKKSMSIPFLANGPRATVSVKWNRKCCFEFFYNDFFYFDFIYSVELPKSQQCQK